MDELAENSGLLHKQTESSEHIAVPAPSSIEEQETFHADTKATKPIHTLVLDTGPLIKNEPAVSTLLAQADELYTIPSVLAEIRDQATRSRIDTTLLPFLKFRTPRPESVAFCTQFARKTGDLEVLSRTDLHLIALAYDLELERNNGDWRLRREPAQKGMNGKPPGSEHEDAAADGVQEAPEILADARNALPRSQTGDKVTAQSSDSREAANISGPATNLDAATAGIGTLVVDDAIQESLEPAPTEPPEQVQEHATADDSSDSEGWITPSNLHRHKAKDSGYDMAPPEIARQQVLQVALLTSDYAMQNVLLRMNLNLVSPALARITRLKTWVLRCHGCFTLTRDMSKQFCPSCGKPTLTRVSCSTSGADGSFQVHLKRNFQFNKRGNVYSIPKPVHGSASGKAGVVQGGGQGGWAQGLILAEDQKEYARAVSDNNRRAKEMRDLRDPDYLPGVLGGDRKGQGPGRVKVGAGRNVNARRRK